MYWDFIEKEDLELYLKEDSIVNSIIIKLEGWYSIDCRSKLLRYAFDNKQTKFEYKKDGVALKKEDLVYPMEIEQYFDVVYRGSEGTRHKYVDFKYFINNFAATALEETMYSEGGNCEEIITFNEFFTKLKTLEEPILVFAF